MALDRFGRILRMTPAVAAILGYTPTRLAGRRMNHRVRRENRGALAKALGGQRDFNLSVWVRTKSDAYEPVRLSLSSSAKLDAYGRVVLLKVVRERTSKRKCVGAGVAQLDTGDRFGIVEE